MATGVVLAEDLRAHLLPAREIEAREHRERLSTGAAAVDEVLGGGWPRGTLCEVRGGRGQGRTAIMLASLASALRTGQAAALIDFSGNFDPAPAARAGVRLERLLWVRGTKAAPALQTVSSASLLAGRRTPERQLIGAAEAIVSAGGFGLVALDFGEQAPAIPTAAWLRLRRLVAAPGTVLLVVTVRAPANLFGATCLCLEAGHPHFRVPRGGFAEAGPTLLESIEVGARSTAATAATAASAASAGSWPGKPPRLTLLHRPA